jgi:hypothetical protein
MLRSFTTLVTAYAGFVTEAAGKIGVSTVIFIAASLLA